MEAIAQQLPEENLLYLADSRFAPYGYAQDLSDVMFVATANSLNIPPALLDRMEVIRLSGYTEDEKLNIGKRYLVPKQIENNGLKKGELTIDDSALMDIIRYYTREAGATPKDGPSAGAAMTVAMVSVLTGIPVRADVAMTGEITLRGEVLAIGGLKEKLLAAHRAGIKTVIIPEDNFKDLTEIPKIVQEEMTIVPVKWIDQVLDVALECSPEAKAIEKSKQLEKDQEKSIDDVAPVIRKKPRAGSGVQKH
ncbi:unnamed protein product [Darwinula stevensoni]|uniref:Lon proteolytic domain-containing protein n=1 Tax=Darwinula stevensoni TaxID=69355 RepID=A0A7R9FSH9_9CRUS|nr:unnamed protein product [Darwinula stevensoni]CAG0903258.1 unnamed protein product [Darwinula stevensoni]